MSFRTSLRRTLQPIQSTLTASPSPRPSFIPFPLLRTTPSYRPQSTFSSSEKHDAEKAQAEAAEKQAAAGGADGVGAGSGAGKASGADVGGKGKSAAPGDEGMKKVKDLEDQVKELKSQIQYSRADLINLTRRTETEKQTAKDYAIQSFASDLLSTIDILHLALHHVPKPLPPTSEKNPLTILYDGVNMTKSELLKVLERHGVKQFDPTGEKFDPNLHEALYMAPIPGKEAGTVAECSKLGYMMKGRTLRPAQVGVVQDMS